MGNAEVLLFVAGVAETMGPIVEEWELHYVKTVGVWAVNTSLQSMRVVLPSSDGGLARVGYSLVSTGMSSACRECAHVNDAQTFVAGQPLMGFLGSVVRVNEGLVLCGACQCAAGQGLRTLPW
jgi:hypothetical protein